MDKLLQELRSFGDLVSESLHQNVLTHQLCHTRTILTVMLPCIGSSKRLLLNIDKEGILYFQVLNYEQNYLQLKRRKKHEICCLMLV